MALLHSSPLTSQEDVDSLTHTEGQCDHAIGTRLAIQAADEVTEVVQHAQIVFYNNDIPLLMTLIVSAQQLADDLQAGAPPHTAAQGSDEGTS